MKSLKAYLLIAVFAFSTVFFPRVLSAKTKPVRNRSNICNNIVVHCMSCSPQSATTQTAQADRSGHITAQLPGPGTYKITYGDGANKGQEIQTVIASKAERVSLAAKLEVDTKE